MPDRLFRGCGQCSLDAPLTVAYEPAPPTTLGLRDAVKEARQRYALFAPTVDPLDSRRPTPLDLAPRLGHRVYLKNEAFSLTGSHKDRYNAVASRVARRLDALASSPARLVITASPPPRRPRRSVSARSSSVTQGSAWASARHRGVRRHRRPTGASLAASRARGLGRSTVGSRRRRWTPSCRAWPTRSRRKDTGRSLRNGRAARRNASRRLCSDRRGRHLLRDREGVRRRRGAFRRADAGHFAVQPEGANSLSRSLAAGRQIALRIRRRSPSPSPIR